MSEPAVIPSEFQALDAILSSISEISSSDLIPILQEIQNSYGYLPVDVLKEMSRRTGIPASQIYGVATFYEQFHLDPRGRHTLRCCRGTACHVRGGKGVIRAVSKGLAIEAGQTTEDMQFTFETVACLGACALSPVMVVGKQYYGKMTPQKAKSILRQLSKPREEEA